jgi:NMD protein affecting ribosome stability and mRNA decay
VTGDVPGYPVARLSGDYRTTVFEGPFKRVPVWARDVERDAHARGKTVEDLYFFYTTCPKCAKAYGKNYVVAVARERDATPQR